MQITIDSSILFGLPRVRISGCELAPFRYSRCCPPVRRHRDAPGNPNATFQERHQRSAAMSSAARASTQRAPAPLCSFFQNGARVFR